MAINFDTPAGKVRLLTADLDETNPLVTNEVIAGYLALHEDNHYLAAADVLDAMATSEVLLARKIRTQDLSTDGPAVAAELRKQAVELRARASAEDSFFEIVPLYPLGPGEAAESILP